GIHDFKGLSITKAILPLARGAVRIDNAKGKPAKTTVDTLTAYKFHTLVSCKPLTGRMHQLRVHLSSVGAPIVGDEQYGGKAIYLSQIKRRYNLKKETEEQPL